MLKDGQWMIANETDIRLGPPPPNLGKMIAIASEGSTVWGVVTDQGPTTRLSDERRDARGGDGGGDYHAGASVVCVSIFAGPVD